jgi:hypothetical protein
MGGAVDIIGPHLAHFRLRDIGRNHGKNTLKNEICSEINFFCCGHHHVGLLDGYPKGV